MLEQKWIGFDSRSKLKIIDFTIKSHKRCHYEQQNIFFQVLRRHLIHIFMHDFPEHYGEVLLMVLKGCSENKLMPSILLELLNTIYKLTNCPELDANSDSGKMKEDILYFATNQKLFSYRDLYETIALFARHFQNERLQHGLNGLYPIHKNYCKWISVMFETFVHSLIVSAVHTNPGALSDTRKLLKRFIFTFFEFNFCFVFI